MSPFRLPGFGFRPTIRTGARYAMAQLRFRGRKALVFITMLTMVAELLDKKFGSDWSAKPQLAVLRAPADGNDIYLFEVDEPVETTLQRLPRTRPAAAAAGITALGHTTQLTAGRISRKRVRVTIAVTCCGTLAIIRSADGHEVSDTAEGELIVDLRKWSGLATCSCTST